MRDEWLIKDYFKRIIRASLFDDHGMSEDAFFNLYEAIRGLPFKTPGVKYDLLDMMNKATCSDGRYFYDFDDEEEG